MLWGLRPVAAQAASGVAVDRFKRQIHCGLLLPDEKLPPERRLAAEVEISRVTLREALRVLENERYISVKRGAYGGAFVANAEVLQKIALRRIARDPAAIMRILEFRGANETTAARLAATRRGIPELKRLRQALDAMRNAANPAILKQSEALFRLAIGDGSHNPHIARAIEDGLADMFAPFASGDVRPLRDDIVDLYQAVFDAIDGRNADAAETAVTALIDREWADLRALPKVA